MSYTFRGWRGEEDLVVYLLGGIGLVSEIPLPELSLWTPGPAPLPQISIRLGSVPASLQHGTEVDPDCFATRSEYLLNVQGIARYLVLEGREVIVEPAEGALALDVRAYLLGTIFAILCHQRGLLPLHASAVSWGGGVIAFLGHSGEGKSSLAANLALRGFPVVADDICLVDAHGEGPAVVIPVAPWLKLWRASLDQLGLAAHGLDPVFSEDDKYRFPVEQVLERQPIRKLIFLERRAGLLEQSEGSTGESAEIREVTALRALPLLMNLTHHAYLLEASGRREENFLHCGRVVAQAKAYSVSRPWGFAHMDSAVDAIERLLREQQG
jgi:hypothetical protein